MGKISIEELAVRLSELNLQEQKELTRILYEDYQVTIDLSIDSYEIYNSIRKVNKED